MTLLIKNGRVIDPANQMDEVSDVFISEGIVQSVRRDFTKSADLVINATGCWVTPGFVDLHAHLREPGYEYKENIESGSRAAAKGGFTTICCMPNTKPVIDNPDTVRYINAASGRYARVLPIAGITTEQKGERLTDMALLKDAGVCGFSEDGKSVMNARLMKRAFEITASLDLPVFDHCEDINLANSGVINESRASTRLSLPGITPLAEDIITARDLLLAENVGGKIHLCHVSTQRSAALLKEAKSRGVRASGEVCPHHFCQSRFYYFMY